MKPRRAISAFPRRGIAGARSCSSRYATIQAIALAAIARTAHLDDLAPAGAGRVVLVLRAALHDEEGAAPRLAEGRRRRMDAGVVAERGALRRAERSLGDAGDVRGQRRAELLGDAAVALHVIGPGH